MVIKVSRYLVVAGVVRDPVTGALVLHTVHIMQISRRSGNLYFVRYYRRKERQAIDISLGSEVCEK